jgi:hypothetical protein
MHHKCGLTAEEGQRKLNDELAALFHRGMHLSGDVAAAAPPAPMISSATVAALGHASTSGGGGGGGGGGSGTIDGSPVTSRLGYNISQHYHHSTHMTNPRPRPVSSHAALGGSHSGAGGPGHEEGDMDMDAVPTESQNQDAHAAEPYMKSGYEYLAERDYNRQAQSGAGAGPPYPSAFDPAFSSKEWWRDFSQPIEFQYGMFQQLSERRGTENEPPPNDDEQMVL